LGLNEASGWFSSFEKQEQFSVNVAHKSSSMSFQGKICNRIEAGKGWNAQAQRIGADTKDRQGDNMFIRRTCANPRRLSVPVFSDPSSMFNREAILEKSYSFA
jgi:hypothetical protein